MRRLMIIISMLVITMTALAQKVDFKCNVHTVNKQEGQWRKLWRLDDPDGGYVIIRKAKHPNEHVGILGILLYKDSFTSDFWAYELQCPVCKDRGVQSEIGMRTNIVCECRTCKSEWQNIHMGSACRTNQNGGYYLKVYNAESDDGELVRVTNWF